MGDLGVGVLLAAVIGIPGLGLYLVGHALGITVTVVPAALNAYWWTVPVLVLQAVKNAVPGGSDRRRLPADPAAAARRQSVARDGLSAVLRGSYHLYQGFGPFLGNAVMGVVFAEYFRRRGRVMPLIVAHTILDTVTFVGYQLFRSLLHLP